MRKNSRALRIAPLSKLGENAYLLELWHGPTCAFKDMALQLLPRLMTVSMQKSGDGKEIVILVATSGDTGKPQRWRVSVMYLVSELWYFIPKKG